MDSLFVPYGVFTVENDTPPSDFFDPKPEELTYFRNLYFGGYGLKYNSLNLANSQEPMGSFIDLIGNNDILYKGIPSPAISFPITIKNRFTVMENQPLAQYESDSFPGMSPPYEQWFLFADQPGQDYEGRTPGGDNKLYTGNLSYTDRIINSGYGILPNSSLPPFYKLTLGRLRVNSNHSADYWKNNVFIANLPFQGNDLTDPFIKTINGVGVNTNVADFWFAQLGVVDGSLTDTQALELYNAIQARWTSDGYEIGVDYVTDVLFTNLTWNETGDALVPSYTVQNIGSKTLSPVDEWVWEWRYKNDQTNFAIQAVVGNTRIISTDAYPSNTGGRTGGTVKWRVKPKFTDGTYMNTYVSNKFANIPSGSGS